jgi:hypothetical protein
MSADAKRVITSFGNELFERESGLRLGSLKLRNLDTRLGVFSPDGQRFALGGGGDGFDENQSWRAGRTNTISVFRLTKSEPSTATGPTAGSVSWDIVPATLREPGKPPTPLKTEAHHLQGEKGSKYWWTIAAHKLVPQGKSDPMDILASTSMVLVHRQAGMLDVVLRDPHNAICALAWDGSRIWVASKTEGVTVINPAGKVLARLDSEHGLPRCELTTDFYAVGPNRMLVAGGSNQAGAGGWCAVVDSPGFKLNVFLREANLPKEWAETYNGASTQGAIFIPQHFTEPPSAPARPAPSGSYAIPCRARSNRSCELIPRHSRLLRTICLWVRNKSPCAGSPGH